MLDHVSASGKRDRLARERDSLRNEIAQSLHTILNRVERERTLMQLKTRFVAVTAAWHEASARAARNGRCRQWPTATTTRASANFSRSPFFNPAEVEAAMMRGSAEVDASLTAGGS